MFTHSHFIKVWTTGPCSIALDRHSYTDALFLRAEGDNETYVRSVSGDVEHEGVMYYCWEADDVKTYTFEDFGIGSYVADDWFVEGEFEDGELYTDEEITVSNRENTTTYMTSGVENGTKFRCDDFNFYDMNGNSGLTKCLVGGGIEKLTDNCFRGCTNLTEVILPDTLKSIESSKKKGNFLNCTSLESIVIPDNCSYISTEAFKGCTNLTAIYYNGDMRNFPWGCPNENVTLIPYE